MTSPSPLHAPAASNFSGQGAPSRLAWLLGLAGLLPFVAATALQWVSPPGWRMLAAMALLSYGAVIVSFLGGIHWGLAMRLTPPPAARLLWGVLPSLLAWLALLLDSPRGHALLALSLLACYLVDRGTYRALGLAAWLPLRALLTTVATACVVLGGVRYGFY